MKTLFTTILISSLVMMQSLLAQQHIAPLQMNQSPSQAVTLPTQANQPSPEEIEKQKQALRQQKKNALEKEFFADIRPQTDKINQSFFEKYKYLVLGIVVAVLVVLAICLRKKKAKIPTPYEEASLRFEIVKNSSDKLDVKSYAQQVSQIVRDYIDKVHHIPAPERTTEEFLEIASQAEVFSDDAKNELSKILKLSDMAKFAKHSFTGNERDELLTVSIKFVEDDNATISNIEKKK